MKNIFVLSFLVCVVGCQNAKTKGEPLGNITLNIKQDWKVVSLRCGSDPTEIPSTDIYRFDAGHAVIVSKIEDEDSICKIGNAYSRNIEAFQTSDGLLYEKGSLIHDGGKEVCESKTGGVGHGSILAPSEEPRAFEMTVRPNSIVLDLSSVPKCTLGPAHLRLEKTN